MGLITPSTPTETRKAPPEVDAEGPEFELRRLTADVLIRYGLVGWTYPEPCDDEHKALLDVRCRDWIAGVITEMNVISEGEARASGGNSGGGAESLPSLSGPTVYTEPESV